MRKKYVYSVLGVGFLVANGAVVACGSDDPQPGATTSTGGTSPGAGGGTSNPGNAGGPTVVAKYGSVSIRNGFGAGDGYSASALFSKSAAAIADTTTRTGCETGKDEASGCFYTACEITSQGSAGGAAGAGGAAEFRLEDAGKIDITGGTAPVSLVYDATKKAYPDAKGATAALYNGEETITFNSAGSPEVPSFSAQLTAPGKLTLSAPALSSTAPLDIPKTAAIAFTWSGGAGEGEASVSINSISTNNTKIGTVFCTTKIASGSFSIPASVIDKLPVGSGSASVSYGATKQVEAGDYKITLSAPGSVVGPDNKNVFGIINVK